ncbi:ciliary microtubule-associated protein 3-like [Mixophyes fleayi]|uniref:ciliary microtubule-associated protein 3-like n=1 Tax=Mixophyes fleayi TaxID=3061075 RepID=UPI003F4E4048
MERKPEYLRRICFESRQDRKCFPNSCAPDRLGIELAPIRGAPNVGPGRYNIEEFTNLKHLQQRKPLSKKGYCLGARTAPRFPPDSKMVTAGPADYQSDCNKKRTVLPSIAPFNTSTVRFSRKINELSVLPPSPGPYNLNAEQGRRVTWPGRFGSPDWAAVATPNKRTVRVELITDKLLRKNREKVAYLRLYED